MRPYFERDGITIYQGDALAVLRDLPTGCVDVLITDPPYSSGGMVRNDRMQDVHTKYVRSDSYAGNALSGFSGDNRDQRAFGYWVALWLSESQRVVKPGGIAALFSDWRQLPVTTDALQAGGYVWRGIVPWYKPNGRPTQGRWANTCEYVVWGTNGPRALEGNAFKGFFEFSPPPTAEREHVTQKPIELMRELLRLLPDTGVVLDPFMGSGSTLRAAMDLGRKAIGIELEEFHCATAVRRLAQSVLPLSVA